MIHIDTSALIASLTGHRTAAPVMRGFISDGIRLGFSVPVLYEWLRGPRVPDELSAQEILLPTRAAFAFGADEAKLAADLYRRMNRPRWRDGYRHRSVRDLQQRLTLDARSRRLLRHPRPGARRLTPFSPGSTPSPRSPPSRPPRAATSPRRESWPGNAAPCAHDTVHRLVAARRCTRACRRRRS